MQAVANQGAAGRSSLGGAGMAQLHQRMPDLIGAFSGASSCGTYQAEALLRFNQQAGKHFVSVVLRGDSGEGKPFELPVLCESTPATIVGRRAKPDGTMTVDVKVDRTERPTMTVTVSHPQEQLAYKITMPVRL